MGTITAWGRELCIVCWDWYGEHPEARSDATTLGDFAPDE